MTEDMSKYRITPSTTIDPTDVDLDQAGYTLADGTPLTESVANRIADELADEARRRRGGRPSLSGSGSSPQVAFRITPELRARADELATKEGRPVSAIARQALEEYLQARTS